MRNQHIARMCSLGLLFSRRVTALAHLTGQPARANSVDGSSVAEVDCSRSHRVPDVDTVRRGPSHGLLSAFLVAFSLASLSLVQGCADPATPAPAAGEKKDVAIGVDAEFGVETFALASDPVITITSPTEKQSYTLSSNAGTIDIDMVFTLQNFVGQEAHCYLDGGLMGTYPLQDAKVTFAGLTKGAHTLACTLLDETGQEYQVASARGVVRVFIVAPCTQDTDCADGNGCTIDKCAYGKCQVTWNDICCASDFNCAVGTLCINANTFNAVCSTCQNNTECSDGDSCTTDTCDLSGYKGKCVHTKTNPECCSKPTDACSDGQACTLDSCDTTTGTCTHVQPADTCCGDAECASDDPCLVGKCISFKCRFAENILRPNCCSPGFNTNCDDKSICTTDTCSKAMTGGWTQCEHAPDPAKPNCCMPLVDNCDDGQNCTLDQCVNNQCVHTVNKECCKNDAMCDDGHLCTIDACNVAQELCTHTPAAGCCETNAACDDQNYCTNDFCDTATNTCKSTVAFAGCCNLDTECNDGKVCTIDACINHQCLAAKQTNCCDASTPAIACADQNVCTVDSCDLTTNKCIHVDGGQAGCCNYASDCDDGDCGTVDSCDASATCQHKQNPYTCKSDLECDDGKPCTKDTCALSTDGCGACQHDTLPIDQCCMTDAPCIQADQNKNPYAAVCHTTTCDLSTHKCQSLQKAECCATDKDAVTACDDNNVCTVEYCQNNQCRHSTPPVGCCTSDTMCDDGVGCSLDKCNIAVGSKTGTCQYTLPAGCAVCTPTNSGTFTDTNPCTADSCVNGVPTHTPIAGCCIDKTDCDDGKPCTADSCNATTHQCLYLDSVGGQSVCCNPNNEAIECASFNSDCAEGKCLQQSDGTLACQAQQKDACTVALSYCQDFEGTGDLPTLGWKPKDLSGDALGNWGVTTTGNLGPDRSAKFTWTPTKVNYDTCLQSPVFLAANANTVTMQFDREFIPSGGETSIRILGSLDGTYADWTQATVIESFTTTSGVGPETVNITLPQSLTGSNGLRLAFCVSGAATAYLKSYALDNICIVKGSAPTVTSCPANQIVPTGTQVTIPVKIKDPDAGDFITAQLIGAPSFITVNQPSYFFVDKSWNTSISIQPTVLTDVGEYQITLKVSDGYLYKTCKFSVAVTYQGGVLVWRPSEVPQVMSDAVKAGLTSQGKFSQVVNSLALYPSLTKFDAIFVLLGNYPYNHVLGESEVNTLKLYLAQGGKIYMEGGDTFMYDPKTSLHPYFQTKGIVDEAPNGVTGPLKGYAAYADNNANPPTHYGWNFNQDPTYDNLNDQIDPDTAIARTRTILRNDGVEKFTVQVGHDDKVGKFRTIASSIPYAGVTAGTTPTNQMMKSILAFFANGFGACVKNTDCDDGNSCTQDVCSAGECVNNNVCICSGDTTLGCGDTATKLITNSGASTQAVSTYTCDPSVSYLGKEVAFKYKGTTSRPVTVTISNLTDPTARLFVLKATSKGCDPEGCVAAGGAGNTVTFAAGKDQLYYFVVDVPAETGSTQFDISVTCGNGEDCANSLDDNGNNLVDCSDLLSCCGDTACQVEVCDGIDNTCNGVIDEGCDDDGDGYCDSALTVKGAPAVCSAGVGDCNDNDSTVNPGIAEFCGNGKDDNCNGAQDEDNATGCTAYYRDVDLDTFGSGSPKCKCGPGAPFIATKGGDCNDANIAVNPGMTETCATSYDDNCNGDTNDQNATNCSNFYTDLDSDGYGTAPFTCQCVASNLMTATKPGDCLDTNAFVNPGKAEVCNNLDDNCSGTIDEGCDDDHDQYCDADITYDPAAAPVLVCEKGPGDSDDNDPLINPEGQEICDNKDNNSNGQVDEGCDKDGDDYCDATMVTVGHPTVCPHGGNDCDDTPTGATINPGVPENCATAYDDNCNGSANDQNATNCTPFFFDADGDKWGTNSNKCLCVALNQYRAINPGDCNENDATVNPGVKEICDGIDNNCDKATDETCDVDGDGYCSATATIVGNPAICKNGLNDCNDTDPNVNPGVVEVCANNKDDNCDGSQNSENAIGSIPYYQDLDGDTYGTPFTKKYCAPFGSYTATNQADCDDSKASVNPGAVEICDNIDNNCNGGVAVAPPSLEIKSPTNTYTTTHAFVADGFGNARDMAQPFVPVNSGSIKSVDVYVTLNYSAAPNKVLAYLATPPAQGLTPLTTPVLVTVPTVSNTYESNFPNVAATKWTIDFPSAAAVTAGTTYVLVIRSPANGANVSIALEAAAHTYSGGSVMWDHAVLTGDWAFYGDRDLHVSFNYAATGSAATIDEGCDDDQDGQCDASMGFAGPVGICANGGGDCNDNDATIFKGKSQEICDDKDDDCNGLTDNGCDDDKDGYCDAAYTVAATTPAICSHGGGDCDDLNSDQNPGAPEVCGNGVDDNCNGSQNDLDAAGCTTYYFDGDNDTYGLASHRCLCAVAGSYRALKGGDCDDATAAVNPGATETCDALDNNCDGNVDENGATGCTVRYYDADNDGYGLALSACTCAAGNPYRATQSGDCDDTNASMYPTATEKCDNIDNNCNSKVDESCNKDGDQFCDKNLVVIGAPNVCPLGGGDCDDNDASSSPGGTEICDGKDNNCTAGSASTQTDISIPAGTATTNSLFNFVAQGLVAQHTGSISSVDYYVNTNGFTVQLDMYVYTGGLPGAGGTLVGAKTSLTNQNTATLTKKTFTPTAGSINLTAGQTYYIIFNMPTAGTSGTGFENNNTDAYAGGSASSSSTLTGAYTPYAGGVVDVRMSVNMLVAGLAIDEGCDDDGDTYCDANMTTVGTPAICTHGGNDCDDGNASISPAAAEVCGNTIDENCSGGYNDLNATGCTNYYADYDGDTYGKGGSAFQKALINEIKYSTTTFTGGTAGDAIELLVTADLTATDIAGLYFGDANATGTGTVGVYHLNLAALGITSLKAGSIVVVGGKATVTTQDTSYNPAGGDWNLALWTDGAYVSTDTSGGDFGLNDAAWVGTSITAATTIDSWVWGTAKPASFLSGAKASINTAPSASSPFVVFTSDITGKDVAANYSTLGAGTLGSANGGANTTFVNFLRTVSLSGGAQCTCTPVAPFSSTNGGDCDDGNYLAAPNLAELCDGIDNNCNGVADEGCDDDGDGFCDSSMTTIGTPAICPNGGGDCDDTGPAITGAGYAIHPGASDTCSPPADLDCIAGIVPTTASGTACTNFYWDGDGDGYGVNVAQCLCAASGNYKVNNTTDCDDTDATINPGATEKCSTAKDDNCNGSTNDTGATGCIAFYKDGDLDGYGANSAASQCQCVAQGQYVASAAGDCDDTKSGVNPGATEVCDAIDNNCNVGGTQVVNDVNITTSGNDYALVNFVAQTLVPLNTGSLTGVDVYIKAQTTGATFNLDMYVYSGNFPGQAGATAVGTKQTISVTTNTSAYTKFSFAPTGINLTAGTTYYIIFNGAGTSGQRLQASATTGNPYASGSAYITSSASLTAAYSQAGSGPNFADLNIQLRVTTSGGATVDEGCDDDADNYCDAAMYIASTATCTLSSKPSAGSLKLGDDCNDTSSAVKPSVALETLCDNLDNNCDGTTDDGCDADKDGYCNKTKTLVGTPSVCFNGTTLDCDDTNSNVNPGKTEMCDGLDNNCNSSTDENCDKDGDKYCDAALTTVGTPSVCTFGGGDCNDTVGTGANFNPGKTELCDGVDNNCVGGTDEGCNDADGDGYCTGTVSPGGKCPNGGNDCDDTNANVNPGKTETCATSYDDNCNGLTNEVNATACTNWYVDADQDGFGSSIIPAVCQCKQATPGSSPNYSATVAGDCNDASAAVNPNAVEICDAVDNNCNTGGSTSNVTDANIPGLGTPGTNSINNYIAQGLKATVAGSLTSVTVYLNTVNTAVNVDLYVYKGGLPGTGTLQTTITRSVTNNGLAPATFTIASGVVTLAANDVYFIVVHPQTTVSGGTFERNTSGTSDATSAYPNGYASNASALAGPYTAYGSAGVFNVDVRATTVITQVIAGGPTVDEGCDADGDLHCAVGKIVTSAATCTANKPFPTGSTQSTGDDCNDSAAGIFVGAAEICDNLDNNCNSATDEVCDLDNDNYCATTAVMAPSTVVATCTSTPTAPATGTTFGNDCNDGASLINPGVTEDCSTNGIDDNCNGTDNELNATNATTYYKDADGDGWGVAIDLQKWCRATGLYNSTTINDCDDTNAAIKGGGVVEVCDGKDNNCNGATDEGCDDDKDGYCDSTMTITTNAACASTTAGNSATYDCDDTSKNVRPGLTEMCDNLDNNCNASTDENCDKDGDKYCDAALVTVGFPTICNLGGGDCNDTAGAVGTSINPGKTEVCGDAKDNNCNGATDEQNASGCVNYYFDGDQDGYPINSFQCMCANNLQSLLYTVPVSGALLGGNPPVSGVSLDCNDNPASNGADVYPSHLEWCDGLDNNCVSGVDEQCDKDGDTYCDASKVYKGAIGSVAVCVKGGGDCNDAVGAGSGINPGATESCDNVDQNCNGVVDDNAANWCSGASGPLVGAAGNSTVACVSGVCQVTACAVGYANINGTALPCNAAQAGCSDGCECNTQDAFEPNNTCPGAQLNNLLDYGACVNGLCGGTQKGTAQTIKASIISGTDHDWYYFYAQDVDDTGTNGGYDLYTVRALLNGGVNNGAVMEVFRANSVANLCPNLGAAFQNYGSATPGSVVAYQNAAGNNGNGITSTPSAATTKPVWNTFTAQNYAAPGTGVVGSAGGAAGGSTPTGWNMVCCGDTDFWWYTSGNSNRQSPSNAFSEWGEWPCSTGDTYDQASLQSTPSAAGSYVGSGEWIAQGWLAGATPASSPTPSVGAHPVFPVGYDRHRCIDDSAWYAIHIFRPSGTNATTCTSYTLEVSNGVYATQRNDQGKVFSATAVAPVN